MHQPSHIKARIFLSVILIIVFALLWAFSQWQQKAAPPISISSGMYPNKALTPGATLNVGINEICVPGYTKQVRDVPVSLKREVYHEYGLTYPQPAGTYEVDHFIPLTLGGSNDITNLWPEKATPKPGFHEKDEVELYLHDQVCAGKEALQQAQQDIQTDWYKVYLQMPHTGGNGETIY